MLAGRSASTLQTFPGSSNLRPFAAHLLATVFAAIAAVDEMMPPNTDDPRRQ
jgi:hypothetical protein